MSSISLDTSTLNKKIDRWYEAIKEAQEEESVRLEGEIGNIINETASDRETEVYYKLILFRYHLSNKDIAKANRTLEEIEVYENNELLQFYYYNFKGIYHYILDEYQTSIEYFKKAQPLIIFSEHQNEIGEFHYKLAATYFELYQNALSIRHLDAAAKIFQKNHVYKRSADCELLLALNLQDLKEFEEAEIHYHNALRYCDHFKDSNYKHSVLFNLGIYYFSQNHLDEAFQYFNKTKEYFLKENNLEYATKAIYQLAKLHYVNNELEKAERYQKDGLLLAKQIHDDYFINKFKTVQIYSSNAINTHESKIFEGISYFEENKLWNDVIKVGEGLAEYFHDKKDYEKASMVSKRVILAKKNINS
ncbi:tetratricopeptide repeat protein [Pseudalkalibacillus sp. A8]|uniref:tetratricopeptide repeat protein n=1 Tax=Pseudalkalibacillus sp. A8 TaxID=3382641 RepID=UPI0038B44DB1